jgi:flagellin
MGLRIQNNIEAMNAHRQLTIANAGLSKSLERLSSGYRINRAADDAAGLSISQSFRANIAALKVASRNTSEASSLLQVAEGAMDAMGNMLTRLNELATQAASDNVSDTERTKINSEASFLLLEIDRIADSTKYGQSVLLDGSFGGKTATRANAAETYVNSNYQVYKYNDDTADTETVSITAGTSMAEGVWTLAASGEGVVSGDQLMITNGSLTVTSSFQGTSVTFDEIGLTLSFAGATTTSAVDADTITVDASGLSASSWTVDSDATASLYTVSTGDGTITLDNGTSSQSFSGLSDGAQTLDFSTLGVKLAVTSDYTHDANDLNGMTLSISNSGTKTFQIGADNNTDNRLSVSINNVTTSSSGLDIASLTLDSRANAQVALDTLSTAISTLTARRADIGAYMNRLSYAAANIATAIENTQAAESVIRDVDMAQEMTSFTKNQILMQAGTAMLAQANMAPQSVLSLFGG